MTDEQDTPQAHRPLLPPAWFVQSWNEHNAPPWRTRTDPLVTMAWHMVTAWQHEPQAMVRITGV